MNPPDRDELTRRKFMRSGLVGAGAAAVGGTAGWLLLTDRGGRAKSGPGRRFTYDLDAYERIDPALMLFREAVRFPTGMTHARRLTAGRDDKVYVVGNREARIFDKSGQLLSVAALGGDPLSVCASSDGRLFVGFRQRVDTYDEAGRPLHKGEALGGRSYVTAVAPAGDRLFIADAGNREVVCCEADGGVLRRFGKKQPGRTGQGFVVPSPYFDLNVDQDGLLHVANPGRHRLETFSPGGRVEEMWGQAGNAIEAFSGCCNPSYFALRPDGGFITSEKGLNRIKSYDRNGRFEGVVAGPEQLVEDPELARKACGDCRIGYACDVAVDSQGRVLVLDPCTQEVRIFVRKEPATAGRNTA